MEKETVIRWDGYKDRVRIFTASKAVAGKIERAGHAAYRQNSKKGRWSGSFYDVPYKALRWGVRLTKGRKTPSKPPVPDAG